MSFSRTIRKRDEQQLFFFVLSALLLLLSVRCQRISATSPEFTQFNDDHQFSSYGGYGTWQHLDYATGGPSPRLFAASTSGGILPPPYDPSDRSGFIVFGGTTNPSTFEPTFNDLWVLNPEDNHNDGRTWTEIPIAPNAPIPEPRCLSAIAVAGNTLYLFGGFNGTDWFDDLWSLDLGVIHTPGEHGHWQNLGNGGPPKMCGMAMFYSYIDSEMDNLVVYGGGVDKNHLYSALWYDDIGTGEGWSSESPDGAWPKAREFFGASISKNMSMMVIFGGYDYGYTYYNDLWMCDLSQSSWTKSDTPNPPEPRSNVASALVEVEPSEFVYVVYGGRSNLGQTVYGDSWVLNKLEWQSFTAGYTPGPRYGSASGAFNKQNAMILFGGADENNNLYNDTWLFYV